MSEETVAWTYTAKTAAEIETLAWDITGGRVFGTWGCSPDQMQMSFMILAFMETKHIKNLQDQGIAHLYEYIDKAGPRSVNGYPSFMSAQYLSKDDWDKVLARLKQIEEFKKTTAPT